MVVKTETRHLGNNILWSTRFSRFSWMLTTDNWTFNLTTELSPSEQHFLFLMLFSNLTHHLFIEIYFIKWQRDMTGTNFSVQIIVQHFWRLLFLSIRKYWMFLCKGKGRKDCYESLGLYSNWTRLHSN